MNKPAIAGGLAILTVLAMLLYKAYGKGYNNGYTKAKQEDEKRIEIIKSQYEEQIHQLQVLLDQLKLEKKSEK